jgi:trehalose 6-phosphate phosphatase
MSRQSAAESAVLRILAARPGLLGDLGFFFDFDGTLAAKCANRDAVVPADGVSSALGRLAVLTARTSIISARTVADLRLRIGTISAVRLFGQHGHEFDLGDGVVVHPLAESAELVMAPLAERARVELPIPIDVEYKRLAIALHFRTAPSLEGFVATWSERQARLLGLRVQPGHLVYELLPGTGRDKGSVVREEADGLAGAFYFGDDTSDLAAFDELRSVTHQRPGFVAACVAVEHEETDRSLLDQADLVLRGVTAIPRFLRQVIRVTVGEDAPTSPLDIPDGRATPIS